MANYGDPEYWENRYANEPGERYDWLEDYHAIKVTLSRPRNSSFPAWQRESKLEFFISDVETASCRTNYTRMGITTSVTTTSLR